MAAGRFVYIYIIGLWEPRISNYFSLSSPVSGTGRIEKGAYRIVTLRFDNHPRIGTYILVYFDRVSLAFISIICIYIYIVHVCMYRSTIPTIVRFFIIHVIYAPLTLIIVLIKFKIH